MSRAGRFPVVPGARLYWGHPLGGILLDHEAVYHEADLIAWFPRSSHTRTQARHRFWRSTRDAGWDVGWTRVRVVARYVRPVEPRDPYEVRFAQCERGDEGAVPVWRCETLGANGRPMSEGREHGVLGS
jgi:hypothetical protein